MYSKFGQPKWILDDQMLKLVRNGQLPTVISSTYRYIKTHDSESRGQEEAGRTSELFTDSTSLKLANALNKPP